MLRSSPSACVRSSGTSSEPVSVSTSTGNPRTTSNACDTLKIIGFWRIPCLPPPDPPGKVRNFPTHSGKSRMTKRTWGCVQSLLHHRHHSGAVLTHRCALFEENIDDVGHRCDLCVTCRALDLSHQRCNARSEERRVGKEC